MTPPGGPGGALVDDEATARALGDAARAAGRRVVVVSACLLGHAVRWDGRDLDSAAVRAAAGGFPMPVCPELLAGMGCPRPPIAFDEAGRAVDDAGADRSAELAAGAERAAALAAAAGATRAILKDRSPSCGSAFVHVGALVRPGRGVFAARLVAAGIDVISDRDVLP